MSKAILTIDDAPTKLTPKIIDYLSAKGITPVINFIGCEVDKHFDEAVYVAKNGIVIGNHSFTHPNFSELELSECRDEIEKTEHAIDGVYKAAGAEIAHRVFRFPYGDKGGAREAQIQKMLRDEFGFERLDDSEVLFPYWKENHLDTDINMHWSFDFLEYELSWMNGFTWDTIVSRIHDSKPEMGSYLLDNSSVNIVLMHDMEETEAFLSGYYEKLIDYALSQGVEFIKPRFVKPKPE
ncbi:MAG: polysaccharide deacetylase family protein [Eubacteriales bacterium]|nr:polysaccharide deacetylase family protein [Eubacteriales bacterium]MDD3881970.1 polysaccharide deacetylase family protein [Eubacteriales bacterium]MDD4513129.1 polysaccharide deacetylase family protein [Eubacteriales bacterium]